MPSKSNERFLRADRRNKIEKVRLDHMIRTFDRERSFKAHEIDREKKNVVKSFESVRRTSGISDQGVQPKNTKDTDFLNEPVYRMGLRISERRLMEWRNQEKELERTKRQNRIQSAITRRDSQYTYERDENGNIPNDKLTQSYYSLSSDDEVFSQNDTSENLAFDPQQLTENILEEYKSIFKKSNFKIGKAELKRIQSARLSRSYSEFENKVINDKMLKRPHTANITSQMKRRSQSINIPPRPSTASSCNRKFSLRSAKQTHNIADMLESRTVPDLVDDPVISDRASTTNTLETKDEKSIDITEQQSTISNNTVIEIVSRENEQTSIKNGYENRTGKGSVEHSVSDQKENGESEKSNTTQDTKHERIRHRKISSSKFHDMKADTIPEDEVLNTLNEDVDTAIANGEHSLKSSRRVVLSDKPRRMKQSVYTIPEDQTSDQSHNIPDNMSETSRATDDVLSQSSKVRQTKGRQRRVSVSTVSSDRPSTLYGSVFGSTSDLSVDSNGQRRPSRWREFVAADNAPIPETKKLVSVTTVVRAALAFSKNARKRALSKLVEEQSADAGQIIRQERLRRLHSRNDILTAIANNWTVSNDQAGLMTTSNHE